MSFKKLLSVAEIARELEIPESTLHYWKNRFAQYLPSVGKNRQKRFRPEAVAIFKLIKDMLATGHTSKDVMAALSKSYPVNVALVGDEAQPAQAVLPQVTADTVAQMGAAIGAEIAKAIIQGLGSSGVGGAGNGNREHAEAMGESLALAASTLEGQSKEIEVLKDTNTRLEDKLTVMESELIRLRKDRREMEKFLLDKIKNITS